MNRYLIRTAIIALCLALVLPAGGCFNRPASAGADPESSLAASNDSSTTVKPSYNPAFTADKTPTASPEVSIAPMPKTTPGSAKDIVLANLRIGDPASRVTELYGNGFERKDEGAYLQNAYSLSRNGLGVVIDKTTETIISIYVSSDKFDAYSTVGAKVGDKTQAVFDSFKTKYEIQPGRHGPTPGGLYKITREDGRIFYILLKWTGSFMPIDGDSTIYGIFLTTYYD